jgi:hypothetical protein
MIASLFSLLSQEVSPDRLLKDCYDAAARMRTLKDSLLAQQRLLRLLASARTQAT